MISWNEIFTALYGVWRLAHFDEDGWKIFDTSTDGVRKSFFAAVLVAPAQAIIILLSLSASESAPTAGPGRVLAVFVIGYVIGWVVFPLIMYGVCQTIAKSEQWGKYVVGYNWASVLQVGIFLPIAVISVTLGSGGLATFLSVASLLAVATYAWFIARTGLDIPANGAVAVVLLDLLISVVLNTVTRSMLGWF